MEEQFYKYAKLLLTKGLAIKEKQPLLISAPIESIEFIRVLTDVAISLGVKDIYYDWTDDTLKHTLLKSYDKTDIEKNIFWNKTIHDEYAKKNAAFLFLIASNNNIMQDIPTDKIKFASSFSLKTREYYRILQEENKISWCIGAVATKDWAKLVFNNDKNSYNKLWSAIFKMCLIDKSNPVDEWSRKIEISHNRCKILTNMNIKELHYQNKLGTDLKITLAKNNIWCDGTSIINKEELLVNIPTEEVFTTPNKYMTNGIVYCSKPLVHAGIVINDIVLVFKDGKVIEYNATSGKDELANIINYDSESSMLGEAALVDKNSAISKSNILFYETLFDENAACHIALGQGFKECINHGFEMDSQELETVGYNKSKNHVDIMIGTEDLTIKATTYDNEEIVIFKNGSFTF